MTHDQSGRSSFFLNDTERPGMYLPLETQQVIRERYELAAQLCANKRVLEVGPGCGWGLEYLGEHSESIVGLEYCRENVSYIQNHLPPGTSVLCGDAHNLPFVESSVDIVVAMAMIYYLDFDQFLKEAHRVLTDEGLLFFCTSNKDVPGFCSAPGTNKYYSLPELRKHLEQSGFTPKFYTSFPVSGNFCIRWLLAKLKMLSKAIVTSMPHGRKLWSELRTRHLGDHDFIPSRICDMLKSEASISCTQGHKVDNRHRVIYGIASKTDQK